MLRPKCQNDLFKMFGRNAIKKPVPGSFVYYKYWGTWHRVLKTYRNREIAVVDLTAINPTHQWEWERYIRPIFINRALFDVKRGNIVLRCLPEYVHESMNGHLEDDELVERLLTEDFIPIISWRKFNEVENGGAKLSDILLD
ncbi:MAG: hypothetical protein GY861_21200 [bacterium]|nr:hypothetical protein [bacterium]